MLVAAAVGDLNHAETVAVRVQPHRLRVDRDGAVSEHAFGQILFVEVNGQAAFLCLRRAMMLSPSTKAEKPIAT